MERDALVTKWFELTRARMPGCARERGWPVRFDHCFQRILLDNAVGAKWTEHIAAPAYRNSPAAVLLKAIALGEDCLAGRRDLSSLNRCSLQWRDKLDHSGRPDNRDGCPAP